MTTEEALVRVEMLIDDVCDPKGMTQGEYRDFLEELAASVESRLRCVKAELGDE